MYLPLACVTTGIACASALSNGAFVEILDGNATARHRFATKPDDHKDFTDHPSGLWHGFRPGDLSTQSRLSKRASRVVRRDRNSSN